jgi:TDG/mug DNA glycosylase family protein
LTGRHDALVDRSRLRPTPEELAAAATNGSSVPDVVGPGLRVLFCGINPGLWSGAVGHHFAHPGNRFWKALAAAGFTEEVLAPEDERRLLDAGVGVTNLVNRTTRTAAELTRDELRQGVRRLEGTVRQWAPASVAVLGVSAYRTGFDRPRATIGLQPEPLAGAPVWVVPNPSGLQAHYPFGRLVEELVAVREARSLAGREPVPWRGSSGDRGRLG